MVQRDENPDTDEVIGHAARGKAAHEEVDDTQGHGRRAPVHEETDDTEGHGISRKF